MEDENNSEKKKLLKNITKGNLAILGCLIFTTPICVFPVLQFLTPYIASFFYYKDTSYQPKLADIRIIQTIYAVTMIIFSPICIKVAHLLGYRITFAILGLLFSATQLGCSYLKSFWAFTFIYAIGCGICQSGCIILPLYCGWRYFPARMKARVSGFVLCAVGLALLFNSYLAENLINPRGELPLESGYYSEEVAAKLPDYLFYNCFVSFVFAVAGILMILRPEAVHPEEEAMFDKDTLTKKQEIEEDEYNIMVQNLKPADREFYRQSRVESNDPFDGEPPGCEVFSRIKFKKTQLDNLKTSDLDIFKQTKLYHAWVTIFFLNLVPQYLNESYFRFAELKSVDLKFTKLVYYITLGVDIVGRVFSAIIVERTGFAFIAYSVLLIELVVVILFFKYVDVKAALVVLTSVFRLCDGAVYALYPLMADAMFNSSGALAYSFVYSGFCLSEILVIYLRGWLEGELGSVEALNVSIGFVALLCAYNVWMLNYYVRVASEKNTRLSLVRKQN